MSTELERLVAVVALMRALHVEEYAGIVLNPVPLRWTAEEQARQERRVEGILGAARE